MERVSRCFRGHDVRVECSARPRWMQRRFRSAGASTCAARVVFFETRSRINARRRKKGWGSGGGARTSNLRIGGGHRGGGYGFAPALLTAGRELEFVASLRGGGRAHGGAARRSVGKKVDWITRWGGGVSRKRNAVPSGCRVRWEVRAAMLDLILIRLRCCRGTAHKQPEKFVSRNTQYVMDTVGPALRWVQHVPDGAATSGTEHM